MISVYRLLDWPHIQPHIQPHPRAPRRAAPSPQVGGLITITSLLYSYILVCSFVLLLPTSWDIENIREYSSSACRGRHKARPLHCYQMS